MGTWEVGAISENFGAKSGILAIYDSNGVLVWDTAGTDKQGVRQNLHYNILTDRVPLANEGPFSLAVTVGQVSCVPDPAVRAHPMTPSTPRIFGPLIV